MYPVFFHFHLVLLLSFTYVKDSNVIDLFSLENKARGGTAEQVLVDLRFKAKFIQIIFHL